MDGRNRGFEIGMISTGAQSDIQLTVSSSPTENEKYAGRKK